jgi:hypothetical protein
VFRTDNLVTFYVLIFYKSWEPQTPRALGVSPRLYRDNFTFFSYFVDKMMMMMIMIIIIIMYLISVYLQFLKLFTD